MVNLTTLRKMDTLYVQRNSKMARLTVMFIFQKERQHSNLVRNDAVGRQRNRIGNEKLLEGTHEGVLVTNGKCHFI